ncbi:MAG: SH3 domain-containing protein [Saprospiraceae bacterium]|nr:SH3 domain-containing protein [Bacteroidia bacterium]MBT8228819.1 SH3 domain-containing protein [Bacteroidia bacterium]NNF22367.1 SH3 domain-containing protein [Saprospiraceae bacterium]NNK89894.1 SH3 domain-containing protein [Saprospiraceae bacterium]
MAKRRYGEKQPNIVFRWIYFVIFLLIAVWLLGSILAKKSPANTLKGLFSKIPGDSEIPCEELLIQKDSIIKELEAQVAINGNVVENSGRGMVIIDSQALNMRSKPSLSAEILLKIPANSEVEILYYDSQTYYLEGLPGKWCRIKYADTEGWVWGNYIKAI